MNGTRETYVLAQLSRDYLQSQEALRDSETRFRLLVDSISDYAIFMLDPKGHVMSWNKGAERIKGYRAEDIIGRHFSCFYLPEDVESGKPKRELKIAAAQGRFEDEGWRARKDGTRFWANVVITALMGEAGGLQGFANITRDITERRRMVEELRDVSQRLRAIIRSSPLGIVVMDAAGAVTMWDGAAERIFGWADHEIVGCTCPFVPEETEGEFNTIFGKTLQGASLLHVEMALQRREALLIPVSVSTAPLKNAEGKVSAVMLMVADLGEQKAAEDALRDSEVRFRLSVESVRDYAIFMLDPEGHVISWNAGAERIKGYRAEEILGRHFSCFYPPEAAERGWPQSELTTAASQGRFEDEGWRVRKDGSRFWANVVITALRNDAGQLQGFAKITRDMTTRKRGEDETKIDGQAE